MYRRDFLIKSASAATALLLTKSAALAAEPTRPTVLRIPRRRGFNLTELAGGQHGRAYLESDFAWMAEWGFDFARLPISYWTWSDPHDWKVIDERALAPLDQAIEWGRRYKVHVNVNLHRIPGYCVNRRELEPFLLFESSRESMDKALDAAAHHWRFLAHRYRDISPEQLSFDLLNEPPFMADQTRYVEIVRALVSAIRESGADRLIVVDGADLGQTPVPGIVDLNLVQSTRGYLPKMVSHFTATWVPKNEFESFEKPTWPMTDAHGQLWNRDTLREKLIEPWRSLTNRGVPIHVGEWGCFVKTPHDVALAWMSDLLALWKEAGWGWAMWNLRGQFGIVDSGRDDVAYEEFKGHKLDRKMLELLLAN